MDISNTRAVLWNPGQEKFRVENLKTLIQENIDIYTQDLENEYLLVAILDETQDAQDVIDGLIRLREVS